MAASAGSASAGARSAFSDFSSYEARSLFLRGIEAPFDEPARRVLGHMGSVHRYLRCRSAALPETVRVSVILTPSADAGRVDAALRSILAQTYRNIEVLVCGYPQIVARDPRLRVIDDAGCRNLAARRNRCWREANGDYLLWLDGHTTLDSDCLRILLGAIEGDRRHDPRPGLAYAACQRLGATGEVTGVDYASFSRPLLENRPCVDLGCVLHARALLSSAAPFDEAAAWGGGWLALLRMTEGRAARAVPCVLFTAGERSEEPELDATTVDAYLQAAGRLKDRLPAQDVPGFEAMYAVHGRPRSTRRRPVSIVIPSYECPEHLRLCVAAVRAFTTGPFELVIVDNASSMPVLDVLDQLQREGVKVIRNSSNRGFTAAANQGIGCSAVDHDVVLLNNDAVVTPGWLEAFEQALDEVPEAGAVVPRQVLLGGTDTLMVHQPACRADREMDVNISAHHDNIIDPSLHPALGLMELRFAPYFCVYLPRTVIEVLGPLDEETAPHYRSDRLYCEAIRRLLNRRIIYTPHAKLYHFLQRATLALAGRSPAEYDALFVRNELP